METWGPIFSYERNHIMEESIEMFRVNVTLENINTSEEKVFASTKSYSSWPEMGLIARIADGILNNAVEDKHDWKIRSIEVVNKVYKAD